MVGLAAPGSIKGRPHRFLDGGVVGGDVKDFLRGLRALVAYLVNQGLTCGPRKERPNDVGIFHVGDSIALLGEAPDVLMERLSRLLLTVLEVPWVSKAFVRALEVSHKDLPQIRPVMDLVRREVLEPCMGRVR